VRPAERRTARLLVSCLIAVSSACTPPPEPDGAQLYAGRCAPCHGENGEGDGPLREVLRVDVPSLRILSLSNGDRFPESRVRAVLQGETIPRAHGDAELPVWGNVFGWGPDAASVDAERAAQRVDALIEHLRGIQYR